jgi:hypothetical protein
MHFGDSTIIYKKEVLKQNIFPWLKGTIESRQHFRSIAHSSKKVEPPKAFLYTSKLAFPGTPMGRLLISRTDSSAASARRRTTAHSTVVSRVLCSGYVVNKMVSCVLMNMILVTLI